MKLFISGDPHVNLGKYNHTTGEMCARRKAVTTVFREGLAKALKRDCVYMHTGDFLEGPLSNPNLTTPEQWYFRRIIQAKVDGGLDIAQCPIGNHDLPKSRYTHVTQVYPTSWNNLPFYPWFGYRVMVLNFCPDGQEAAEKQFEKELSWTAKRAVSGHVIVVAHHLFEGQLEFGMNSPPTHENWFKKDWVKRLKQKLGSNVTVVLGHDHLPWEQEIHGIRVINIGSPTAMVANDVAPRRFMTWCSETGRIEFVPVKHGLKQSLISNFENVTAISEDQDRVVLDMEIRSQEDEEKLRELIQDLKQKGIEYTDKTSLFQEDVKITNITGDYGIIPSFDAYCEDVKLSGDVKDMALAMMADMGVL